MGKKAVATAIQHANELNSVIRKLPHHPDDWDLIILADRVHQLELQLEIQQTNSNREISRLHQQLRNSSNLQAELDQANQWRISWEQAANRYSQQLADLRNTIAAASRVKLKP